MLYQDITLDLSARLNELWALVVNLIPRLVGALVIIIVGFILAAVLKRIIVRLFEVLKIDEWLRKAGVEEYVRHTGLNLKLGVFVGVLVYWFVLLVFILATADVLKFDALSGFVGQVLNFIPNVVVAALILAATLVAAKFVRELMERVVMGAKLHGAKTVGLVSWWIVVVFGLVAVLEQLHIAPQLLQAVVTGLIAMLALAGGLAFGLGGKEYAAHLLDKAKRSLENHG